MDKQDKRKQGRQEISDYRYQRHILDCSEDMQVPADNQQITNNIEQIGKNGNRWGADRLSVTTEQGGKDSKNGLKKQP